MFRDLDSVITPREISAVSQWLDSKHAFHVMRDHPNHGTVPMMAGMWGVKVSKYFQCKGKESINIAIYFLTVYGQNCSIFFQVGLSRAIRAALRQTFLAILQHPRAYTKDMNRYLY